MAAIKHFHQLIRMVCALFLVALTLSSYAADQPEWHYIAATSANLREKPTTDSKVIIKLAIGSPVRLGRIQGDWVDIHDGNRGWLGWVRRDLIADKPPTLEGMLKAYRESKPGELDERRKWLERALAIDPVNTEALEALAALFQQVGDAKNNHRIQNELNFIRSPDPSFDSRERQIIFVVRKGYIEPFGYLESSTRLRPAFQDQAELDQLIARYLRAGRRYNLFDYSGTTGTAMIVRSVIPGSINLEGCTSPVTAEVKLNTDQGRQTGFFSLATNRPIDQERLATKRELTPDEKALVKKLSESILLTWHTKSLAKESKPKEIALLKRTFREPHKISGAAIQLEGHDGPHLIAATYFGYESGTSDEGAFGGFVLLALKIGEANKADVVYQYVDGGSGDGIFRNYAILGFADLNQDGIPDIFTDEDGYEHSAVRVHLSQPESGKVRWKLSPVLSVSGC